MEPLKLNSFCLSMLPVTVTRRVSRDINGVPSGREKFHLLATSPNKNREIRWCCRKFPIESLQMAYLCSICHKSWKRRPRYFHIYFILLFLQIISIVRQRLLLSFSVLLPSTVNKSLRFNKNLSNCRISVDVFETFYNSWMEVRAEQGGE